MQLRGRNSAGTNEMTRAYNLFDEFSSRDRTRMQNFLLNKKFDRRDSKLFKLHSRPEYHPKHCRLLERLNCLSTWARILSRNAWSASKAKFLPRTRWISVDGGSKHARRFGTPVDKRSRASALMTLWWRLCKGVSVSYNKGKLRRLTVTESICCYWVNRRHRPMCDECSQWLGIP